MEEEIEKVGRICFSTRTRLNKDKCASDVRDTEIYYDINDIKIKMRSSILCNSSVVELGCF
jgi:3'-phosphoadenosine 5'-phosphosulfate sulfotransferase